MAAGLNTGARRAARWLLLGIASAVPLGVAAGLPKRDEPVAPPQVLVDPNAPEAPAAAASARPAAADPVTVEAGRQLYKNYCQKCHGLNMVSPGGAYFDLRHFPPDDKARFVDSVTLGKRAMPAWGGTLQAQDIDRLWAYVMSGAAPR